MEAVACLRSKCLLKQNLIPSWPANQLHFQFPVQNKIHKQKILSDTQTGILGSIAGPYDSLPARSDEFQKVCIGDPWLITTITCGSIHTHELSISLFHLSHYRILILLSTSLIIYNLFNLVNREILGLLRCYGNY